MEIENTIHFADKSVDVDFKPHFLLSASPACMPADPSRPPSLSPGCNQDSACPLSPRSGILFSYISQVHQVYPLRTPCHCHCAGLSLSKAGLDSGSNPSISLRSLFPPRFTCDCQVTFPKHKPGLIPTQLRLSLT